MTTVRKWGDKIGTTQGKKPNRISDMNGAAIYRVQHVTKEHVTKEHTA